jgi:hypothetical protein
MSGLAPKAEPEIARFDPEAEVSNTETTGNQPLGTPHQFRTRNNLIETQ